MTEIRFREVDHTYWLGDREVPGLSKILQTTCKTKDYTGIDPWFSERGQLVHKSIEMDLANDLDIDSLDPILAPFYEAWCAFMNKTQYKPISWEEKLYSPSLDFACRYDHYGELSSRLTVIDVKCTKRHDRGAKYQLCGQTHALEENGNKVDAHGILELHDDATYEYFSYPVNRKVWPAVMEQYRYELECKK
jgi:hypothetical protein